MTGADDPRAGDGGGEGEELAALLAAVLERPDDDVPRLAYAAALDARGDARGELIRVQCARAARYDPAVIDDQRRRERELLAAHGEAWAAPARECASKWVFRRGFVDEVTGTVERVVALGAPLFAREPVRIAVLYAATSANAPDLAAAPWLARIERLAVHGGLGDEGVARLAASPHVARLASINLSGNAITPEGLAALIESGALASCTTLCLTANELGDEGVALLAASPELAHIHTLYLAANEITADGLRALAESEYATGLTKLCVGSNELGEQGALALANAASLAGLRKLELCRTELTAPAAQALAASTALASLRSLNVRGNGYAWMSARPALEKRFGPHLKA